MKYYNRYGLYCIDNGSKEIKVMGIIEVDGEEIFQSVSVEKGKVNKVSSSTLIQEYVKKLNNKK